MTSISDITVTAQEGAAGFIQSVDTKPCGVQVKNLKTHEKT